jgi:DNA-binding transcriptional MerR regulator
MSQPTPIFSAKSAKLYTIGQVLNELTQEFNDLTQSKLRFLEENGLVSPQRTDSGYRKFSEADVNRVRLILELQRERYLPLKVIRQYLDDLDQGKQPALPGQAVAPASATRLTKAKKITRIELIAETAITDGLIQDAQSVGLIGEEPFDSNTIEIARSIMQLQRFGITPRHLRGVKAAADREIGIIQGVIAPVLGKKDSSSRSRAAHFAGEIQAHFAIIRNEMVIAEIAKIDD